MNECCKYAHYYLGCDFRFTWPDGDFIESRLEAVSESGFMCGCAQVFDPKHWKDDWYEIGDFRKDGNFQLILIDPTDMNTQQKKEYKSLCYFCYDRAGNVLRIVDTPLSLDYCFRNGIDAFDLIESGHAIDRKSV